MSKLRMKYFVVKPEGTDVYAKASKRAMRAYAKSIRKEDPELAEEIREFVKQATIRSEIKAGLAKAAENRNKAGTVPKDQVKEDAGCSMSKNVIDVMYSREGGLDEKRKGIEGINLNKAACVLTGDEILKLAAFMISHMENRGNHPMRKLEDAVYAPYTGAEIYDMACRLAANTRLTVSLAMEKVKKVYILGDFQDHNDKRIWIDVMTDMFGPRRERPNESSNGTE